MFANIRTPSPPPPARTRPHTEPDEPVRKPVVRPTHDRRPSREDNEYPTPNDNTSRRTSGGGSAHQRGGQGAGAGRQVKNSMGSDQSFDRSPLHPHYQAKVGGKGSASPAWEGKNSYDSSHGTPGRSRMKPDKGDETPNRGGAAVPRFGEWDEKNPSSGENYTHIFNKLHEERVTGSPMVSGSDARPNYNIPRKEEPKGVFGSQLAEMMNLIATLGLQQNQAMNQGRQANQFGRLTKVEFPKFQEDDVSGWAFRCDQFFSIDDTSNEEKVFVHTDNYCKAKQKKERNDASQEAKVNGNKEDNEGFVEVINKKNKQGSKVGINNGNQGNKQSYRVNVMNMQKRYVVKQKIPEPNSKEGEIGINKSTQDTGKSCETSNGDKREGDMYKKNNMGNACNMTPPSLEKIWNVGPKKIMELRKSANKFVVLSKGMNNLEFDGYVSQEERSFVDIWNDVNGLDESSNEEDIIEENNAANKFRRGFTASKLKCFMDFKLVVWNIRGISNELRQNAARKYIQEENVQMCAFIKTHLKSKSIIKVGNRVFEDWSWDSNIHQTPNCCRIMLGWNPKLLRVMMIDIKEQAILCAVELIPNKIRFYCAIVYASNNEIERISLWKELDIHKQLIKRSPWVIMGDFNVTLNVAEHSSGSSGKTGDMVELSDAINNLEVEDICSTSFQFTWTKSLKNPKCNILKNPADLYIKNGFPKNKSSFRSSNFLADKDEFLSVVKDIWKVEVHGCYMYKLVKRLKMLKRSLKKLSWKQGNMFDNVVVLKDKLKSIQADVDKSPHCAELKKEPVFILNDFVEASKVEMKKSKNRVEYIKDDAGVSYEGEDVPVQFVKHFDNFLGKTDQVTRVDDSLFINTLSSDEANNMVCDVTESEVKEAMFDIESNKASGPDGYTSEFFKRAWDVVGKEVCLAIQEFFKNGKLLGEVNSTIIALIPKVSTPCKVSEFRPIACCNVIYKCISKILTNRIKSGLDKIVHINQSAFIPGRHIQDIILIAQELLRAYNRKNSPKRGLRQGDPISPYMFTMVMEVFNLIMGKNIEESSEFRYHFGCKELKLSHMCFADDLLVLCKGNKGSIEVVKKSLEEFSHVSGLVPNLGKSLIFFGSIKKRDKIDLLQVLPFKYGRLPVRYLGVPLLAKKLGVGDCQVLIDKVEERINNWRNKKLSYAG
ncbi:RNA-directed DNA polymerase, eukaryota, reverse transcriptase zinc-binding domain protein [Tanacetum coccineum]